MYIAPLYFPVSLELIENMNWSIAIIGGTIIFAGVFWVVKARKSYTVVGAGTDVSTVGLGIDNDSSQDEQIKPGTKNENTGLRDVEKV